MTVGAGRIAIGAAGPRFGDPTERDAQVVVRGQRLRDQGIQRVIVKLSPERCLRLLRSNRVAGFGVGERRGELGMRPAVVGPDRAGSERGDAQERNAANGAF